MNRHSDDIPADDPTGTYPRLGINPDGSLQPGYYQAGENPVLSWDETDKQMVRDWLAKLGVVMAQTWMIHVVDDQVTVGIYHLDNKGRKHLEGHCDGEETTLTTRAAKGLTSQNKLEVFCVGCGKVLGKVRRDRVKDSYIDDLPNPHNEVCSTFRRIPLL